MKQHETRNTFYHQILHLVRQCQFENINEHIADVIVYGCKSKEAQDKLLQMPIWMTLEECLLICRHYESLQWHINTARPATGSHDHHLIQVLNKCSIALHVNCKIAVFQEHSSTYHGKNGH